MRAKEKNDLLKELEFLTFMYSLRGNSEWMNGKLYQ